MKKVKYLPKISTSLIFLLFLAVNYLLFAGRKSETFRPGFILALFPGFYQHVSNFTISCVLYTGVGYAWLLMGLSLKNIIIFGIVIIAANFIYELWIPLLNTRDLMDAYYGCAGTLVGFIFLLLVKKFGLKNNPK